MREILMDYKFFNAHVFWFLLNYIIMLWTKNLLIVNGELLYNDNATNLTK